MNIKTVLNIVGATIMITCFGWVIDFFTGKSNTIATYSWVLLANSLIVMIFFVIINKMKPQKFQRKVLWLWLIFFSVGYFSIFIEAYIFNVTQGKETVLSLVYGLFYTGIVALFMVWLFRSASNTEIVEVVPEKRSIGAWVIKIVGGDFLYFIFYLIAGMLLYFAYPQLAEFYEGKIPPFATIITVNLGVRGFIFVGIALLVDAQLSGSKLIKGVVLGLLFSIIGGIAPLIPPNELMPLHIRIAHGFEVGISNFLYGLVLIYVVGSTWRLPKQP